MQKICTVVCLILLSYNLAAQKIENNSIYNPHDYYVEPFYQFHGNEYRLAKGVPGHAYWQNSADYIIHAELNDIENSITGKVTIKYTNNSPDDLDYLWIQLDQNIFKPSSIAAATTQYPGDYFGVLGEKKGGYDIKKVTINQKEDDYAPDVIVTDTRMQVNLKRALKGNGETITLQLDYKFIMPEDGAGRFGRLQTKNGTIYQVAQWYPRMCVYDDVHGWNSLPYLGQAEFYCDYGDYDYYITVPSEMMVYGSGDLQNPEEVLTKTQIDRLNRARKSDKTITIVGPGDLSSSANSSVGKRLTWHFKMKNTRDVAWVAGKNMIWDAARINLPSGRKALAMSAYPVESMGDSAWSRSTEYLKACIEIFSKNYFEYPWNNAISSAGITSGMEYPGIIFNNYTLTSSRLWFLVAHEIGHNWFPMIVGSNERRYMWLDEGLNTYIDYIATDSFNEGEYKNDPAFLREKFFATLDYRQFMNYKDPLMTVSDAMDVAQHWQYYQKTAYGLFLLRNVIVGKERFDKAFRKYTEAWAFKHPTPHDFFNCINNVTGEDLNWFWKGWFYSTWKLDQAITNAAYVGNDPAKGLLITIENKGKLIMPVILNVITESNKTETIQLPVEIWQRTGIWTFKYPSSNTVQRIILDPQQLLPDMDRSNNTWQMK